MNKITHVSLMVKDQQEAMNWYMEKLGWKVVANMPFPGNDSSHWITIAPPGQSEVEVVLQLPAWGEPDGLEERTAQIGKGLGFVIVTDDCRAETEKLRSRGVQIVSEPMDEPWGVSMVFLDLYGNAHNLLQPAIMG